MTKIYNSIRTIMRWLFWSLTFVALVFAILVVWWRFSAPVSTLMIARHLTSRPVERIWTPLSGFAPALTASVIASEDGRFCTHRGVDFGALREVLAKSGRNGPSRGASTLAMQTAKNLFLWPGRSAIRKGLEIPLAMVIDLVWGKRRVMEVYLNIAEWGDGIFGAEAAAKRYFRKSASELTPREAALLVSALPNPVHRNPTRPSAQQASISRLIQRRAAREGDWLACVK